MLRCVYAESAPTTLHQHTCVRHSWRSQTHTHARWLVAAVPVTSQCSPSVLVPEGAAAGSTVSNLVYLGPCPCPRPRVCVHPPRIHFRRGSPCHAADPGSDSLGAVLFSVTWRDRTGERGKEKKDSSARGRTRTARREARRREHDRHTVAAQRR